MLAMNVFVRPVFLLLHQGFASEPTGQPLVEPPKDLYFLSFRIVNKTLCELEVFSILQPVLLICVHLQLLKRSPCVLLFIQAF